MQGPFSLCPLDPGSLQLVRSLFDELLPHFSSKQFNVGCDETFDLGQGRSKEECERRGTERVYLDYLLQIHKRSRGARLHHAVLGRHYRAAPRPGPRAAQGQYRAGVGL